MGLVVLLQSYDELKEEETSLLKERTNLRKEIATLQTTFKEQRAKNENLKRMKVILLFFILQCLLFMYSASSPFVFHICQAS